MARLPEKTSREWLALFEAADIPASKVNSIDDLLRDPYLNTVGFWGEREHATEDRLRLARFPGT